MARIILCHLKHSNFHQIWNKINIGKLEIKNQNKQRKIIYIKMNVLLTFISVNLFEQDQLFSLLYMEKNLKEEFNRASEEKFIIDQYY